jgi:hypothetical protein
MSSASGKSHMGYPIFVMNVIFSLDPRERMRPGFSLSFNFLDRSDEIIGQLLFVSGQGMVVAGL